MTPLPNWVDLLVLIIVIRSCYIGFEHGLVTALLHFAGAASATTLCINFSPLVWRVTQPWFPLKGGVGEFVVFWSFFVICGIVFSQAVRRIAGFMKWERMNILLQGTGLICGAMRAWWWSAVILVGFASSGIPYLEESVEGRSLLGAKLLPAAQQMLQQAADLFPGASNRSASLFPSAAIAEGAKGKANRKSRQRGEARPAR